jgi:hypothetical protein
MLRKYAEIICADWRDYAVKDNVRTEGTRDRLNEFCRRLDGEDSGCREKAAALHNVLMTYWRDRPGDFHRRPKSLQQYVGGPV